MKDYVAELARSAAPGQALNQVREYLQARILGAMQRAGAMVPLAFHGGTALRFLYASARFSEDLDFALEGDRARYDFRGLLLAIRTELEREGYEVGLRVRDRGPVHSAFVRFPGLPFELGLSPHRDQVLAVKIEVDTQPPAGAVLATTVIRRHLILNLQHHDRASQLAGRLHAILQRPFLKGRDVYDLVWYLSDPGWPAPNLVMLNHALQQTGWQGEPLTADSWREVVRRRLQAVHWGQVAADVAPFLERAIDAQVVNRATAERLLGGPDRTER